MLASRWDPIGHMNRLRHEMDRLFDRPDDGLPLSLTRGTFPPLNMWETDEALFVEAELPGLVMDDLQITIDKGQVLSLEGARKSPEVEGGTWHRRERTHGSFKRSLQLAQYVDTDHVTAEFSDGVLLITLPKREEEKPRRIEVNVG